MDSQTRNGISANRRHYSLSKIENTPSSEFLEQVSSSDCFFFFFVKVRDLSLFVLCMVQFYLLHSPPPGQPRGQVQPFGPGGGNCLKPSCPGGRGRGKSKITSCCSCEVRHLSVDAGPRGEDCLFPVRIARICSRLVREE